MKNSHEILCKEANMLGITVWGTLTSNGLIRPSFFDKIVNTQNYDKMLKTKLWPLLCNCPDVNELLFQQDRAPPHQGLSV